MRQRGGASRTHRLQLFGCNLMTACNRFWNLIPTCAIGRDALGLCLAALAEHQRHPARLSELRWRSRYKGLMRMLCIASSTHNTTLAQAWCSPILTRVLAKDKCLWRDLLTSPRDFMVTLVYL